MWNLQKAAAAEVFRASRAAWETVHVEVSSNRSVWFGRLSAAVLVDQDLARLAFAHSRSTSQSSACCSKKCNSCGDSGSCACAYAEEEAQKSTPACVVRVFSDRMH